jgi:hypothetical protein
MAGLMLVGAAPFGLAPFGAAPFGLAPFGAAPFGAAPFGLAPGRAGPAARPFTLGRRPVGASAVRMIAVSAGSCRPA